jgi:phosphatidylserine/phosphatidylglycerophosphate/cardiolipin synthase-like enzyme
LGESRLFQSRVQAGGVTEIVFNTSHAACKELEAVLNPEFSDTDTAAALLGKLEQSSGYAEDAVRCLGSLRTGADDGPEPEEIRQHAPGLGPDGINLPRSGRRMTLALPRWGDLLLVHARTCKLRARLFLHAHLHAKIFLLDTVALVGSANLTDTALGWREPANIEYVVPAGDEAEAVRTFADKLIAIGQPADRHIQSAVR